MYQHIVSRCFDNICVIDACHAFLLERADRENHLHTFLVNMKNCGELQKIVEESKDESLNPLMQSKGGGGGAVGFIEFSKIEQIDASFTKTMLEAADQKEDSDVISSHVMRVLKKALEYLDYKKQLDVSQYVIVKLYPMLKSIC